MVKIMRIPSFEKLVVIYEEQSCDCISDASTVCGLGLCYSVNLSYAYDVFEYKMQKLFTNPDKYIKENKIKHLFFYR